MHSGLIFIVVGRFLDQLCLELFTGDEYIRREIVFGEIPDVQAQGGIYGPCDDRAARERF